VTAFTEYASPLPQAPIRFVLLTSADLYDGVANFVFAVSYLNWGALVSTARFGDPARDQRRVMHRVAKQSLASLMKALGVPASSDINCVTSYPGSLDEFDVKGNRPNAESLAIFRENLRRLDEQWTAHRKAV